MEQTSNETGKGRRKALWTAVAAIALVAAGLIGVHSVYEGKVSEFVARSGGKADAVNVDFLGRIHLRNLTLPLADGTSIRIAAVDGRQKLLFLDGGLVISGLDINMPTGTISMAHASVEEANFDNDTLAAIFSSHSTEPVSKRIGRFAAKRIATPELTVTQSMTGIRQKTVYKNVTIDDIASGRIAHYSIDNAHYDIALDIPEGDAGTKEQRVIVSTGEITGADVDAAYMARLYTEKAGPDDKEAKPLYGPFSVKTIAFSDGDSHFTYDEMRSDGFSMRMPSEPLVDTLKTLTTTTNPDDLPPEERKAFFARILSVADMIGKSDIQLLGFRVDAPRKDGEDAGKRVKMTVDRMALRLDNRKLDLGLHGMSIADDKDSIAITEASLTGFSWNSTLEGLKTIAGLDEQEIADFPINQLIPEFGTIRVAGVRVDVANPEKADQQGDEPAITVPERIRFALKSYEMALTRPYNGIPTDIHIRQEDLSLPVPADSYEEIFVQMRQLGFEDLSFSWAIAAAWDEKNRNLVISEISVSGKDIGSLAFSGLAGGFTKEFFSFDPNKTQAALFGLTGREVKFTLEDRGLIAKGIKLYAGQNNMTEDEVRGLLTLIATAALQDITTTRPKLEGAVEALLRFISAPGTLTVTVRSAAPNGLGLFDLIAASENPMLLLDKVNIEATAH